MGVPRVNVADRTNSSTRSSPNEAFDRHTPTSRFDFPPPRHVVLIFSRPSCGLRNEVRRRCVSAFSANDSKRASSGGTPSHYDTGRVMALARGSDDAAGSVVFALVRSLEKQSRI